MSINQASLMKPKNYLKQKRAEGSFQSTGLKIMELILIAAQAPPIASLANKASFHGIFLKI